MYSIFLNDNSIKKLVYLLFLKPQMINLLLRGYVSELRQLSDCEGD